MNIVTENLGKRFNREWIFKKLYFSFEQGNSYAIVGPNGSGKSTLMQVLWGQVPTSTGSITYSSRKNTVPEEEAFKNVSIATPYMELIEEFTLKEMIEFHFKFKPIVQNRSLKDLADLMELSHAQNKLISNFSSGMKQRLKLGLAFFSDTSALFLDEPTTNLDKRAIEWYQVKLREFGASRLVLIASNTEYEYPENCQKVDLMSLK
ncbi:MAG: ABC transporter ATP-binding protein [Cyclobacteriaceae bacterium]|jgi:ABC-type multidrug transport system ATPase subunit|nr:ABC transporter ATP-binding protein [Cyclobacteriaceae bacterium]